MRKAIACYLYTSKEYGAEVPLVMAENDLAQLLIEVGGYGEADGLLTHTLARLSRLGAEIDKLKPYVLHTLSVLRQRQGRMREAIELARRAIDLSREPRQPRPLGEALIQLGELYEASGHPRLADRSCREAIEILREAGETNREKEAVRAYRRLKQARHAQRTQASEAG
jgi:tetratricopeptide (TPR) repeat protein